MTFQNRSDCHNHSRNSYDGTDTVAHMCERAQELGLLYYTLTDHCECEDYNRQERDYKSVVENSYARMLEARESTRGKLNFLFGIELGQPLQNLEASADALRGRAYDFVIGSLHSLKGCRDFYFWEELNLELYTALDRYFEEILQMLNAGGFDSLGHLTYPLRYIVGDRGLQVDFDRYLDRVDLVYKLLIEKGIALELNTSGLRQNIGETLPNFSLLKRYRQMGGELVTIGSDAHCCPDLGKGIQEGMALLAEAGFTHFTVFKNRKPMMIELK